MPGLQKKYPLRRLAIFGSYARGEATEKNDIDIVIEVSESIGLGFVSMADEIEEILGTRTHIVSRGGIKEKHWAIIEKDIISL